MAEKQKHYSKIADYGLIGNLHSVALVGLDGSIDWLCLPHLDSPSVFGALLDCRRGGRFAVRPREPWESTATYLPDTNVLVTRFRTSGGILRVTDFMPVTAEREEIPDDRHMLFRLLEVEQGRVEFEVVFEPRFDYGRGATRLERRPQGLIARGNGERLSFSATLPLRVEGDRGYAAGILVAGEEACLHLRFAREDPEAVDLDESRRLLEATVRFWRGWLGRCEAKRRIDPGPYRDQAIRSLLVLKLLFYGPTGSLAAAATTSLPEEIGGVRNWDYRFCWIRDAAMTAEIFWKMGHREELKDYLSWVETVISRGDGKNLEILYRLSGNAATREMELMHLEGYMGSRPVRIGNAATGQKQHGIYGHLMAGAELLSASGEEFPKELWPHMCRYCEHVVEHWHETDVSIWEMRGPPRHHVHSKVMCWTALDRGVKIARRHGFDGALDKWEAIRDEIRREVLNRGWSEGRQAFVLAYDSEDLDASNLIIPIVGFLPFDDPRVLATVRTVQLELGKDGLLYRYRVDDGLPGSEGRFLLCTCWLIINLARQGRVAEAELLLKRLQDTGNHLGLFSEQYDPDLRLQLGNFPQAFTHLGYLQAICAIQEEKRTGEKGGPSEAQEPIY
ncbi:glycoside hydrolase family 15 protein [Desulfuromonas sp. TF]|uniref:glycoside hydrolase family 15 protein n=1 Tax=Desulfuromonas sp. TF TaxID=1232410 RepID=UPI0006849E25|nr:glycoside hydrolase family 15 protein [Desulfuromonas sp. TF]